MQVHASNQSIDVVRDAIKARAWPAFCIRAKCARAVMTGSLSENGVNLACPSCGFRIEVPVDWYQMSSSKTLGHLLRNVAGVDESSARAWINNVKYTHPTYWVSQKEERKAARGRFREILSHVAGAGGGYGGSGPRIVTIGANNCLELADLPYKWSASDVLAVDLAEGALNVAGAAYPGLRTAKEFAESLCADTVDLRGKKLGNEAFGSFNLCLALRVLQSSRFQLWSALTRIRDVLRPGGWLIASIPRKTSLPSGNLHPGIYLSDGVFDERSPKAAAEEIARELTSGSAMYDRVTLFYGSKDDVEHYVVARRAH